jgi:hypothetical protein
MRRLSIVAAVLVLTQSASAQSHVPPPTEQSASLARLELARVETVAAEASARGAVLRLRATWEAAARDGLETDVRQLQLRARSERDAPHSDRTAKYAASAQAAWSGLTKSSDFAVESNSAFVEAKAASERLAAIAKTSFAVGAAKEELDSPGSQRLAIAREAERRLATTRSERHATVARARALEEQLARTRASHQRLVAEVLSGSSMGKAREADLSAVELSRLAAEAAIAYAQALQFASIEMQLAQLMADAYADIGRASVASASIHQPRR